MKASKVFQMALLGAAALAAGTSGALANCTEFGGFSLFQCADLAYFAPPPFPVTFDPNGRPVGVMATVHQLGFGNNSINTGLSGTGSGNTGPTTFNGNDAGTALVDISAGTAVDSRFPMNAICLRSNNWANAGWDGCCDNIRDAGAGMPGTITDDNILNPYYDVYLATFGANYMGYYSLTWQQDHPVAAILKSADQKWVALAAVATLNRGNNGTGQNGPCQATFPGTNPAPCDQRKGSYFFKDVKLNSGTNLIDPNFNNVVPWQMVPRPIINCVSGCTGVQTRTVNMAISPVFWAHDGSIRPSTNPQVAPQDSTRAAGVGVVDLLRKNNSLVRMDLQQAVLTASNLDPNGNVMFNTLSFADFPGSTDLVWTTDPNTGEPVGTISLLRTINPDTCWRTELKFGEREETLTTSLANCREDRCGDKAYTAASLDPMTITCVGGALAAIDEPSNLRASRQQGKIVVMWDVNSELSVTGFEVSAINTRGERRLLGAVPCTECNTGAFATYTFEAPGGVKGGVKAIQLDVLGTNPRRLEVPLI